MDTKQKYMVGNYVDWHNGDIRKISADELHCINSGGDCNPIELNENWLIKFGFVNRRKWFVAFAHGVLFEFEDDMSIALYDNECGLGLGYLTPNIRETKYVHQLQNLYFAITGEELEIKL